MHKKLNLILLISIILLAAFLRLYRISDYMTFLGDEGRDVIVAKQILEGDFTLLGPRASAGDFYLGPIYYYMIAPFLWLFRYDPVGPAVMAALFGVMTVFLTYYAGKKFFSEKTGLIAAALYAVSPLVITYSRSSWNPNVLPFFALLIILIVYEAVKTRKSSKYFLIAGFLLGIALQLHYLALFLGVIVTVYILFALWVTDKKVFIKNTIKNYLQILAGFLVGFSPFLAFEIRHGFPNSQTISKFIFSQTTNTDYDTKASFVATVSDIFFRTFGRLIFNFPNPDRYNLYSSQLLQFWSILIVIIAIACITALFYRKEILKSGLLFLWLFLGVILFGIYKKPIYDYYLTFIFPLPFLLMGNLISILLEWKKKTLLLPVIGVITFLSIFIFNLYDLPFRYEPNRQKNQIKTIAEFVISKTDNKPYNFALIAGRNSDHGYRYYFDILGHEPTPIENLINDPVRKTVTGQLLIVCEEKKCAPLGYPVFEVSNFGRAEIVGEWNVSVVKVYRLTPYKSE